jgi:uncharacterized membrane protein YagU involved in acid resistance
MNGSFLSIQLIITAMMAGLIGTAGMTFFLHQVKHFRREANTDMVTAVGSLFTGSMDSAWFVGSVVHALAGVTFAIFYTIIITMIAPSGFLPSLGTGALLGLAHGFVMSFVLIASVAEHHPLPQFREGGIDVALAHLFGHVVYGVLVGAVVGLFRMNLA